MEHLYPCPLVCYCLFALSWFHIGLNSDNVASTESTILLNIVFLMYLIQGSLMLYFLNINDTALNWRGQRDDLPHMSSTHLLIWAAFLFFLVFLGWKHLDCLLAERCVSRITYCLLLLWNLSLNSEWLKVLEQSVLRALNVSRIIPDTCLITMGRVAMIDPSIKII